MTTTMMGGVDDRGFGGDESRFFQWGLRRSGIGRTLRMHLIWEVLYHPFLRQSLTSGDSDDDRWCVGWSRGRSGSSGGGHGQQRQRQESARALVDENTEMNPPPEEETRLEVKVDRQRQRREGKDPPVLISLIIRQYLLLAIPWGREEDDGDRGDSSYITWCDEESFAFLKSTDIAFCWA
ncbi:hypothetical protein GYMLUDRAFT_240718 [Collybiopsis luxurians FD-317 M1]|nr:hypothetical protein GYMLUDRAFT_240718 [Collybiopsis luxurians FD-317 M1]